MKSRICARCSLAAVCLVNHIEAEWQVWMCRRCARIFVWLRDHSCKGKSGLFKGNWEDAGILREYVIYRAPPCCLAASLPTNMCFSCKLQDEMLERSVKASREKK